MADLASSDSSSSTEMDSVRPGVELNGGPLELWACRRCFAVRAFPVKRTLDHVAESGHGPVCSTISGVSLNGRRINEFRFCKTLMERLEPLLVGREQANGSTDPTEAKPE